MSPSISPSPTSTSLQPDRRLGALLVNAGKLSRDDVEKVLSVQKIRGMRFGETAVRLGLIGVNDLRRAIASQYDVPHLLPDNADVDDELVVSHSPFHVCAEQFRALRSQLLIRWDNDNLDSHALAVVSPGPKDGRSYIAANLAIAFAQLGEKTLLIDADLRRPRQHHLFDIDNNTPGLSALLSGRADRAVVMSIEKFGAFSVLPAGSPAPNPLELLSRDTFAILLQELRDEFSVIVLDTPAADVFADSQIVAFRAASALLVGRKDHSNMASMSRLVRELRTCGTTVAGSVFNAY